MSNDSMGNLEKLGILVIVILVVVVGVVAITPSDTLFGEGEQAILPPNPDDVPPLELSGDERGGAGVAGLDRRGSEARHGADGRGGTAFGGDEELPDDPILPPWPEDEPKKTANVPPHRPEPTPAPEPVVRREEPKVIPAPVREEPPVAPEPRFRDITVRSGDNLWRIAERELGDGSKWKVIAAANPSVDPDRLQAGQTLRVPLASGSASLASPSRESGGATVAVAAKKYTVQPGDTPMGLSEKFYGTVRHHRFLLRHNGIEHLIAGRTIEVPPSPETSSNLAAPSNVTSSATSGSGERTYVVRKGETAAEIAREQLGDSSRWREILRLNGIDDPRDLAADARIRLPK